MNKDKPTPSAIFWNCLLFLGLFIILFINWQITATVIGILSILALGVFFDGPQRNNPNNIWIWITPTFWILAAIAGIGLSLHWVYTKTIERFNTYLDNRFETARLNKEALEKERIKLKDLDCKLADEFEKITSRHGECVETERLQERQKEIRDRLDIIGWN